MLITLSAQYPWVMLAAIAIAAECYCIGFFPVYSNRKKTFSSSFMKNNFE